jgi:GTP-binding protein
MLTLLDMVIENVPAPKVSEGTQMLITSLDFPFTGRIAIGRLERGFKRRYQFL